MEILTQKPSTAATLRELEEKDVNLVPPYLWERHDQPSELGYNETDSWCHLYVCTYLTQSSTDALTVAFRTYYAQARQHNRKVFQLQLAARALQGTTGCDFPVG